MSTDSKFKIDIHNLDKECLETPLMVHEAHKRLSRAKKSLETVKRSKTKYSKRLEQRVRDKPRKFGIVKLTEGAVQAILANDEKIHAFDDELIELQFEVDEAWADVNACSARNESLSDLIKLYGFNYFDTPRGLNEEGVQKFRKTKRTKVSP